MNKIYVRKFTSITLEKANIGVDEIFAMIRHYR